MKVEPLIYMHYKYNIPYSEMDVVETRQASHGIANAQPIPRSSTIRINNIYIPSNISVSIRKWMKDWIFSHLIFLLFYFL